MAGWTIGMVRRSGQPEWILDFSYHTYDSVRPRARVTNIMHG